MNFNLLRSRLDYKFHVLRLLLSLLKLLRNLEIVLLRLLLLSWASLEELSPVALHLARVLLLHALLREYVLVGLHDLIELVDACVHSDLIVAPHPVTRVLETSIIIILLLLPLLGSGVVLACVYRNSDLIVYSQILRRPSVVVSPRSLGWTHKCVLLLPRISSVLLSADILLLLVLLRHLRSSLILVKARLGLVTIIFAAAVTQINFHC